MQTFEAPASVPPREQLVFWWECFRKLAFESEAEAVGYWEIRVKEESNPSFLTAYACPWGNHWHLGRESMAKQKAPKPTQLRKQWRRKLVKPTHSQLAQAWRQASKSKPFVTEW